MSDFNKLLNMQDFLAKLLRSGATLEHLVAVPRHTHLYRRGAVYYFRGVVPNEIKGTYGKREELRSLRTRDHKEAVRKRAAVTHEVMQAFETHRRKLEQLAVPPLADLSPEQLAMIRSV